MSAQTAFINSILEAAFGGDTYTGGTITMKLFTTGLPSTTGVEVSGGSYAPQTLAFGAAADKAIGTSANAAFDDLPTGTSNTIVAYGIYDGTTLIDEAALSSPFTPDITNNKLEISYSFDMSGT